MTTQQDGGPAYPCLDVVYPNGHAAQGKPGMSLRDHFAAEALAGMLAREYLNKDEAALDAYLYADAMLRARGE